MRPRIDATDFGSITVEGTVFDHDVVISPDGEGQYGRVQLSPEAADFFARKACEIVLLPTPVVIGIWNESEGRAVGLFHVTC